MYYQHETTGAQVVTADQTDVLDALYQQQPQLLKSGPYTDGVQSTIGVSGAGLLTALVPAATAARAMIGAGSSMAVALGLGSLSPALFGLSIGAGVFVGCLALALFVYGLEKVGQKAFPGGGSKNTLGLDAGGSGFSPGAKAAGNNPTSTLELGVPGAGQTQVVVAEKPGDTAQAGSKPPTVTPTTDV